MKFSTTFVIALCAATALAATPVESDPHSRHRKGAPRKLTWNQRVRINKAHDMTNQASDTTTNRYFEDFLTLAFGPIARLFTIPTRTGNYRRDDSELFSREFEDFSVRDYDDLYARDVDDLYAREFDDLYTREYDELYARDVEDLYARDDDLYARDDLDRLFSRSEFDDEM
ncbi:hypothetical protein NLI96_g11199 [Meripilus lineatus]|uniref:Uncharacterized protein n=1 Tax=Meripilus lineatus TaxID=2056292 RepID=A0AAD5YDL6_9APHY|nr:hypothetical protein NLI96_g11199 [Physisporinus lineatus]